MYTHLEAKIIKKFTVCFSGHRKIPPELYETVMQRLEETVVYLIHKGYIFFCAGGALGFDTMAAQTVLKLQSTYPDIRLFLVLPCVSQTRGWSISDSEEYEQIKRHANNVVYVSQGYSRGCMFKRNRHLVDNSSVCVCYLTENSGGTAYTANYAKTKNVTVINIAKK